MDTAVSALMGGMVLEGIEMLCPACSVEVPEDDSFCEACGARVKAAPPGAAIGTAACTCGTGAEEIDEEGFCQGCGKRVRRPASDHIEQVGSTAFAAVSDRGIKHDRNEDRCAIAEVGAAYAMAVCDGVSGSRKSEIASSAVAEGVLSALTEAIKSGTRDLKAAMRRAIEAGKANLASRMARESATDPPSTTVVAAIVADGQAVVGWVGDSRAYWFDANGARQLTVDHSWINAVVATGEMSAEQAERSPLAHGITRWIGIDAGEDAVPDVVDFAVSGPGTLLLCSDGLWNYAPTPQAMAETLHEASASGEDALGTARRLIEFAMAKGGHDNITVAVLRLNGTAAGIEQNGG